MRFAIIGTNFVSDMFMEGALSIDECEVVAVCSRNPQNAQRFAEKYNIPNVFDTYAEMCAWGGFDVAYVATPNSTHKEIAEFFLNAGFHVFCEKPMASNPNSMARRISARGISFPSQ